MKNRLLFLAVFLFISFWGNAKIAIGANNILYVNKTVNDGDESGNFWTNAIPELGDALKYAKNNQAIWSDSIDSLQVFMAKGTYQPLYSLEESTDFGAGEGTTESKAMLRL